MNAENGHTLPVMEYFYSIQGEGFHTGQAAFFIRLGGCDVGCVWCDVKESWLAHVHPVLTIEELLAFALQHKTRNVVITGGEPTMYNLIPLTSLFKKNGYQVWLETSGAYELKGIFDWICVSPKKFKSPLNKSLLLAHELKVVLYNKSDFEWAEKHAHLTNEDCLLYLQPEWNKSEIMMPLMVSYILENTKWRISLQQHKFLKIQ